MRLSTLSYHQIHFCVVISLFFCGFVTAQSGPCCEDYCYSNDVNHPQKSQFATKTSYLVAKPASTSNNYQIPSEFLQFFKLKARGYLIDFFLCFVDCTPKKLWTLNRHGTRLPSAKEMSNMKKLEGVSWSSIKSYKSF